MAKVQKTETCWLWTAGKIPDGYGSFWGDAHKVVLAHRFAYEKLVGPIPDGLVLDHLCRNRACVNPDHLEPVTSRENTMRSPVAPAAVESRQTHCLRGHALSGPNVYVNPNNRKRFCRTCKSMRSRAYYLAKQAAS